MPGIIVISFFHGTIGRFEGISCCTSHNDGPGPFTLRLSRGVVPRCRRYWPFGNFFLRPLARSRMVKYDARECSRARSRKVAGYRTRRFLYRVNNTLRAKRGWSMACCREYIPRLTTRSRDATKDRTEINPTSSYCTGNIIFLDLCHRSSRSLLDGECYNRLNDEYDSARLSVIRETIVTREENAGFSRLNQ